MKMTKRNYFEILRASYPTTADNYEDMVKFIDHEIELLDKKNSADRKPTKKEQETSNLREHLLEVLEALGKPVTVSEIMEADETFGEMSNQRVAALIRGMLVEKGGQVKRIEEKRKAYFSL